MKIKMSHPSQELPASSKVSNQDLKDMDFLFTFKLKIESQIWNMAVSITRDHIRIKIKMPHPSQGPSVSSKALNQDIKDMFLAPPNSR